MAGGVPGVAPPGAGSVPTAVPQGVPAATADVSTTNFWIHTSFLRIFSKFICCCFPFAAECRS